MIFHGWRVYKINGLWNCKRINCEYPIQSFTYVIDAMIYCKKHPNNAAEKVIGQVIQAREIRKARKGVDVT
jgi:hypothetical protein